MSIGHVHGHAGARHRWRLAVSFAIVATFFVVESAAALASGSLTLLSDAGHMAADVVALGAAVVATRIATRPDRTGRRTYGSYRAEVFASGLAVLLMLGVAAYVVTEAVRRIGSEPEVAAWPLFAVGGLGLLVNLTALLLLRGGAAESLNVRGAYLEVLADTASSVGVLVAAGLVTATGDATWDTAIALVIGAFVVVRAIGLGRQVFAVLAQDVPAGMRADEVAAALAATEGVHDVHDLHLWSLTSGMNVATAHLVTVDGADAHEVLDRARDVLRDQHGVAHATLQVEPRSHTGCHEVGW